MSARATSNARLRRGDSAPAHANGRPHCPPGQSAERLRVSLLQVLINTNARGGPAAVDALHSYLRDDLFRAEQLATCLPLARGPRYLVRAEVLSPAIEVGSQRHFVHAHYVLRVVHADRLILGAVAREMQRHIRARSRFVNAFVSVTLLNGKHENYALKEAYVCI